MSPSSGVQELNTRTGTDLGTQVWLARNDGLQMEGPEVSSTLDPAKFEPVQPNQCPSSKPRKGGIWTAQWDPEYGGGWAQWCLSEEYECERNEPTWEDVWLLEPAPDARLLIIDTYADLERVYARWPHTDETYQHSAWREVYPAWHEIAEHFDGVHVTEEGQWRTRLTHPLSLYGWDCESTVWFRWAFVSLRSLGPRTFKILERE